MSTLKLSIIIPCLNEAKNIVATLSRLQSLRARGHEVILSDGGSRDKTVELARALVDHCIDSATGRAAQMNAGAITASGDILCFLHADTLAPENIDKIILNALSSSTKIKTPQWGFFCIQLSGAAWPFRIIERLINIRSCTTHIATGDQGVFIQKALFNQLSGFADIPLMEDIELTKRLKKIAQPVCIKHNRLITSSRRWEKHGIIRTVILMWKLRLAYFLGTNESMLSKAYVTHEKKH